MAYTDAQKQMNIKNVASASTLNAAGSQLGTYYLADNPQYYEVQRTNNFVFYVEGLSSSIGHADSFDIKAQNAYAYTNAEDVLRISVSKSSVPKFTQTAIEVKRGNNTIKFAGTPSFSEGSIQLNDYIGAGTTEVLYGWQQLSYNTITEKVGRATDYKKDAYLLEYTPDYQLVRTWKLYGCWISDLSFDDYNHETNDKHNVSATIQYDKAIIDTSDSE